jgi:hypothetical protein
VLQRAVGIKNLEHKIKDMNVCQAWSAVKSGVLEAMEQCIPKLGTGQAKKKAPWIQDSVAAKIKRKKQAYSKYMTTCDGKDYLLYTKARNQAKKACRNAVTVRDHEKKVAADAKENPKCFFFLPTQGLR